MFCAARAALVAACFLSGAACGTAQDSTSAASSSGGSSGVGGGQPGIEIGTGGSAYIPLAANDALELVHGPQGGWHIDVTARFWGLNPDGMILTYEVLPDGSTTPANFAARYQLTRQRVVPDGNGFVRLGDRAVFDIMDPAEVANRRFTVRVTAESGGVQATDARVVQVVDTQP